MSVWKWNSGLNTRAVLEPLTRLEVDKIYSARGQPWIAFSIGVSCGDDVGFEYVLRRRSSVPCILWAEPKSTYAMSDTQAMQMFDTLQVWR